MVLDLEPRNDSMVNINNMFKQKQFFLKDYIFLICMKLHFLCVNSYFKLRRVNYSYFNSTKISKEQIHNYCFIFANVRVNPGEKKSKHFRENLPLKSEFIQGRKFE